MLQVGVEYKAIGDGITDGMFHGMSYWVRPYLKYNSIKGGYMEGFAVFAEPKAHGKFIGWFPEWYLLKAFGLEKAEEQVSTPKDKYVVHEATGINPLVPENEFAVTFQETRYREVTVIAKDKDEAERKVLRGTYGLETSNHLGNIKVVDVEKSKFSA